MIPRYSPPDMAALFTDAARFGLWLEVELLATEAQAGVGVVPAEEAAICRAKAPTVDELYRAAAKNHELESAYYADRVAERSKRSDADRTRHLYICGVLYEGLHEPRFAAPPLLRQLVDAGHFGRKTGRGFYRYGPDGSRVPD